jgi:hypothetical protein
LCEVGLQGLGLTLTVTVESGVTWDVAAETSLELLIEKAWLTIAVVISFTITRELTLIELIDELARQANWLEVGFAVQVLG